MVIRTINVRHKGQMTLPADVREDLGVKEGGDLVLERRGSEWVLIRPDDVVDPTAGILKDYAYARNPDVEEEKAWIANSIAETADNIDE
ncbi:MAG TPA: AbrB/MazE/SpoVT family DNA-binding domain-containing protein [Thermomicrobiales bacterium]|nr:AbrB/MazE/SpoVT family DNA-binding domain-containing protein [Thermomicrobiales bacterium]